MRSWEEVRQIALKLPETEERLSRELRQWRVGGKLFAWERPLRKGDRDALGEGAPRGPVLGARVEHMIAKQAMLADASGAFFTTPHFDGYPIVLVELERLAAVDLEEVIVEAWLAEASARLVRAWTDGRPTSTSRQPTAGGREGSSQSSTTAKNVLERVQAIPAGFVSSYGDVSPGAPRLAGTVLSRCTDESVPWHRVVRADGRLAKGDRQRRLLEAEGVPFRGDRVDMRAARIAG